MRNIKFLSFAVVVIAVLGVYFYNPPERHDAQTADALTVDEKPAYQQKNQHALNPVTKPATSETTRARPETKKSPFRHTSAISEADVIEAFGGVDDIALSDGRHLVRVDVQEIKNLMPGSRFEMYFEELGRSYSAFVEAEAEFDGIRRLTGSFEGSSKDEISQFSITLSSDNSYVSANFSLKGHSFTSESKNGVGWVNDIRNENERLHQSELLAPTR